jgi:hypothetical protein
MFNRVISELKRREKSVQTKLDTIREAIAVVEAAERAAVERGIKTQGPVPTGTKGEGNGKTHWTQHMSPQKRKRWVKRISEATRARHARNRAERDTEPTPA